MFTKTRFSSWDLPDDLQNGLKELGFEFVTEVQWQTVPIARSGRDVIGQARTGSGKTAAFGIPILEACQPTGNLQGLILAPTRELASQDREELESIQGSRGLKILAVYGGTDIEKQARTLQGGVDLIVGTPGRVMDMTKRGYIDLLSPNWFVLDEADRMLDMGFFPDINWVLEKMESRERTLLFSATFPQEILDAAYEFMQDPDFVITNEEKLDIPPIDQFSIRIGRSNKLWALSRVLSVHSGDGQSIVFVNTKRMVDLIIQRLGKVGFEVKALHGDMNQNQRERILGDFREGKVKTIVATDVAARGIDVDGVTLVVNYDVPSDIDSYVHRIGRTGRIGRKGEAWTLVSRDDLGQMNRIIATHGLLVEDCEAPDMPEGEEDKVRFSEDHGESSSVFGMVGVKMSIGSDEGMTKLAASEWIVNSIRCDELAIGNISISNNQTIIEVHKSKVGLALKAVRKNGYQGKEVTVEVV